VTAGAAAPSSSLSGLARGGTANLVSAGAGSLAGIALTLVVTRGLPAADAGTFFAATSVFVLAERICVLGTDTGLVYFLSRSRAGAVPGGARTWLPVALFPLAAVAVAAATGVLVAAPQLAGLLGDGSGALAGMLRVLAVFLPLGVLCDALLAATRGLGSMRPTALVDQLGRPALQLVLVLVAILIGLPPATAWALPYLPAAALAALWLARLAERRGGKPVQPAVPWRERAGGFWRFTGPRAMAGVGQVALQRLDIVLVAALLGPADAALYTAATRFLVLGQLVGQAFTMAVQPRIAAALARADVADARALYQTATSWLVLVAWPLYLGTAFLAPLVLRLFGAGYGAGAAVTVVLSLTMLVATGCGAIDTVLTMAGRTSWNLVNVLLAVAVDVVLDLVLIPRIGIEGAAIGWAAAIVTNNLLPVAQVARSLGLHPLGGGTVRAMALALSCFAVLPLAAWVLSGQLGWIAAALAAGLIGYGWGCWRSREVLHLTAMLAALPVRRSRRTAAADPGRAPAAPGEVASTGAPR
jgi:O-antigen/teichoic acid export membrane protein